MLNIKSLIVFSTLSVSLVGCQTGDLLTGQNVGSLGGAALGGLVGNQFGQGTGRALTTAGGVILGGALGAVFGQRFDQRDAGRAEQAQAAAFQQPQAGVPIAWRSPETGQSGQVVSGPGYSINGRQCRDYVHTVSMGGVPETVRGVACRQADGTWQVVPA